MADKAVERVEPPFSDTWDNRFKGDDVAYVVVYTHVDDRVESVAFNKTGGELLRMGGDFRRQEDRSPGTRPPGATTESVGRAAVPKPAPEVIPGVPAAHAPAAVRDELPLPHKPLPEPESKSLKPKP
jgi:hypothetical protein